MRILLILACLTGCLSNKVPAVYEPPVYTIANRQLPPQPVYNPVRWVALPDPIPERGISKSRTRIEPIFEFSVDNASSKELCEIMATGLHYKGYCSNASTTDKIKLNTLGTMDEIFLKIKRDAKLNLQLDHQKKEIRVIK